MRIRRSTLPLYLQTTDRVTALLGASLGTYHRDTAFSLTVTIPSISTFLPPSLWAVLLAALYHPFQPKFRLVGLLGFRLVSRRCHNILAMPESSTACSTMGVLTPARVRFPCRHPRLLRTAFPTSHPQTHHDALPSFVSPCSTGPVISRLRHKSAVA